MRKIYIATRAIKSLKQSRVRTILTALAIAVGATTISLALAAGNGGRDYINRLTSDINKQSISIMAMYNTETHLDMPFSKEIKDRITNLPAIQEVVSAEGDDKDGYRFMEVVARDGEDVAEVKKEIETFGDVRVITTKEAQESLLSAVNIAQWGLIGFGALAVIASIFGIINTQYISVLERTRQIGLMKALGMKRADVSRLFRYEAAWIGFLGGAIGVGVAWLITLFNPLISNLLDLRDVNLLRIDWSQVAILIVSLMIVAVLSGWIPARKAANLDPIEALRTE